MTVAWHEVPGKATKHGPSRRDGMNPRQQKLWFNYLAKIAERQTCELELLPITVALL
jgi:hypothetical protein